MLALISLRKQCFILALIALAAIFCCHFGHAQINPMQLAGNALQCFNNKLIYRGCNKEYQLDESGDLDVPCEATSEYCNGPCLSETKSLLNCINKLASNFLFTNRATTQIIGNALDTGCSSYSNQRVEGTFVVGNDYNRPSESCGLKTLNLSSSSPSPNRFQYYAMALIIYLGCNEAFRLNQSGILNIPDNATDQFCKGPCLVETKLLLKCIDKLASTYLFENNARTQDIRNALAAGCSSYTGERGNFDMRGFIQGGSSNSKSLSHIPIRYHALAVVALWYFLLIYHH
ncbi:hypothetical protein ACH5RR_001623 [Cinchona calisaya]|uniref:DUF7731 domain-containing protein n=1 Tax=Cinchona calisaya TaxID=153742 RepID=A0ABD3B560_9GENT